MKLGCSIVFKAGNVLSNMFKSPSCRIPLEALPPLDVESQNLCCLALKCLAQYFSWIPLSSMITPSLLSTVFHFAGFGCEIRKSSTSVNSNFSTNTQVLGNLAMNCINELLSKNCVPVEFEDYLLQMFQQTFYLLQKLTKDSRTNSTGNRLSEIDERYECKLRSFWIIFCNSIILESKNLALSAYMLLLINITVIILINITTCI